MIDLAAQNVCFGAVNIKEISVPFLTTMKTLSMSGETNIYISKATMYVVSVVL